MNARELERQRKLNLINSQPSEIRIHHSKILALFRALDSLFIVLVLSIVMFIMGVEWDNSHSLVAFCAVVLFGYFAEGNEIYYMWRGHTTYGLFRRLTFSWVCAGAIIIAPLILFHWARRVDIYVFLIWYVITAIVLVTAHLGRRRILTKIRSNPTEPRRVAIIGANDLGLRLSGSMGAMPYLGYRIVGFYDDREASDDPERRLQNLTLPVKGGLEQLYTDVHAGLVDIVFITLPMRAEMRMHAVLDRLSDTTVTPYIIPDFFSFNLLHSRLTCLQGIPALSIYDSPLSENAWLKRLEDLVLASGMLIGLFIPMLFIAIGVKLTSKGPIFFKQNRYGMGGEKIKVWKFRSMTVTEDGDNLTQATKQDPRVTPFGGFLRRTSLDELPQLINVIAGSMSLVGPRPHAVAHNEFYRSQIKGYMLRHKVKPGITGFAQVNGFRGETDTLDKMAGRIAYDLEYIHDWSVRLDLKILWLTLFKGFVGENAY